MSKTPRELALEFIAAPDEMAQVKVRLCANGWPQLADMIDEAVCVSRELLRLETDLTAAKEKIAEQEAMIKVQQSELAKEKQS